MESRALDDANLVDRATRGDVGAYEELVRRYQDIAFRVAYAITGQEQEAEDAAQSAFIKAYYALSRFSEGSPFRPWLLKIVSNEARNRRVSESRRARLSLRLVEAGPVRAASAADAESLRRMRREALLQAVNGLAATDRLVIACRYFLGLSEAETAAALGCPRGTVKSRLSRALRRLRAVLTAEDSDLFDAGAGDG